MNTPNWFKGRGRQSLDELLNSLPVLKDPEYPDNRAHQALVLQVEAINGILNAQYVHRGIYVEKPVGFSYTNGGGESRFSLSESYQRVPLREGSVVIPLTVLDKIRANVDPKGNPIPERDSHLLGLGVDAKNILPMFIYNRGNRSVIGLLAESDFNYQTYVENDTVNPIEEAVEPIQSARLRNQYTKFNALKTGFLAGRDFAIKLRQIMEKGGTLDDVLATVERSIPPQYRQFMAQDDKLVKYALRVGMFSHPIHLVRGLSSNAGFSELGQSVNELVRAYIIPPVLAGICLISFGALVSHYININYTEWPEPTRIRDKIMPFIPSVIEQELKLLEPYSCQSVQFTLAGDEKYWLKDNFQESSLGFYNDLDARGYLPLPFYMRALRKLNGGKNYRLEIGKGESKKDLIYIADDTPSAQSGFILGGRGVGEKFPYDSSRVNNFVMDQDGVIDHVIKFEPGDYNNCIVVRPHQFVYNEWLKGNYQWQDLPFAQMQKRVARDLEKIARNPNRDLLRSSN